MLSWDDVRYVLAIDRAGSLSAAARQLGVNQSTVSRKLAAIEEAAGARLFVRTTTGYAATPLARDLVPQFEAVEAYMQAAQRRLDGEHDAIAGTVRLTGPRAMTSCFLAPRLAPLRERYPGIELELIADNAFANLAAREADVAIRAQRPTRGYLQGRKVGAIGRALYATRDYLAARPKIRGKDFSGHAIIGFGPQFEGLAEGRWLARNVEGANVVLRSDDQAVHFGAAVGGVGIAFLAHYVAAQSDALVRCAGPPSVKVRDLWLVLHRDLAATPRIRAVAEFVAELLHDHATMLHR